ncbi:MAG: glycosyltransferase, partial [Chitinispirillaceae bacterium]|nr:glycosyltransferase [Chitinispirillaceae bacterium]
VNAAAGLAARGHAVVCIGRNRAVWLEKAAERGVETKGFPIHADFDPVIITRLFSFFRERRPDILCCNFEKDVRLGGIAGRLAKVKRIFVRKGLCLMHDKWRYRLAYKHIVDDIITPAAFIKKQFAAFPWLNQDRIHVVANGVEVPDTACWDRNKLRRIVCINDEEPVVLGAGTIFSQKGFEYLVEAVAILRRRGVRIHAAIAGDGDARELTAFMDRFGVAPFIHLLGLRGDVPELMYGADAFVLSSIDEGLPNVVLEAMSVGTPVVAADAGGTSEIITDGVDGFVAPVKNPQALADKIGAIIYNKELNARIGSSGKGTVRERYATPLMVDNIELLFSKTLGH